MSTLGIRQGSRSKQSQYGNKTRGKRQNNVVEGEKSFSEWKVRGRNKYLFIGHATTLSCYEEKNLKIEPYQSCSVLSPSLLFLSPTLNFH